MCTVLRWRSLPIVDDRPRSWLLVAIVLAAVLLSALAFGHPGYGVLAAAILGLSLLRYFAPTRYELDDAGVTVRFLGTSRHVPWSDVRRATFHREGVHLSPFPAPSRLDSFRGTFLRYAGNADEVKALVEAKMAASGETA